MTSALLLTKVIHSKALKYTACMAKKKGALVVSHGDHQGATEANHEVRHSEAEDEDVEGLEEGRIPQHHADDKTVVKN